MGAVLPLKLNPVEDMAPGAGAAVVLAAKLNPDKDMAPPVSLDDGAATAAVLPPKLNPDEDMAPVVVVVDPPEEGPKEKPCVPILPAVST